MDDTRYGSGPTSPQEHQPGRLACQACQRKKIKCDRTMPCGQCLKSSLHCVPSTRKQRARHSGKRTVDAELKSRISKLESLVESLSGEANQGPELQEDGEKTPAPAPSNGPLDANCPLPVTRKYVASPFWSSLTSEVQALRDALEEDHDGDTPESGAVEQSPPANANALSSLDYDLIVCPPGRIFVMPGAMQDPSPEVGRQLYHTYLANVEPMYKLFHVPTLSMFMLDGAPYLGQPADSPANQALKRSIWCAALNSLSEYDCQALLGQPRAEALTHYKRLVGISLAQADMVNTTDMATVQALATYLVASRSSDSTRRVWTLTAVLVRIASAMGLQWDDPGRYTPFESELRRRLWHRIRYIDIFCAVDRGSEFLIKSSSKHVPFPTLCNDEDFNEHSTYVPARTDRATDLSFACMTFEACDTTEALMSPDTKPGSETWDKRHHLALDFGQRVRKRYLRHWSTGDVYGRFCLAVAQSMMSSMILRAVRPIGKVGPSTPPRVDSPYILEIATENLRASEMVYEDPEGERLRWMIWVQWHALAVALAGLCSIRGTPLAERAWYYVDKHYERSARYVADSRTGMLWKPVEKLYNKASAFRDAGPKRVPYNPAVDPALQSATAGQRQGSNGTNGFSTTTTPVTTAPSTAANTEINWFAPSTTFTSSTLSSSSTTANPRSPPPATTPSIFGPNNAAFPTETSSWDVGPMDSLNLGGMMQDTSWLDWEEMMADFAGDGGMGNGMGMEGGMQWSADGAW